MLTVCQCSGSSKYVHKECIDKWINMSSRTHCELCLAPYTHIVPSKTNENNFVYCFIGIITSTCSMMHGITISLEAWRGQAFILYMLGMCILFNIYHVIILTIVASWKLRPEVISVLWLVSFSIAMGLTAFVVQMYNMYMFFALLFNVTVSLICVCWYLGQSS